VLRVASERLQTADDVYKVPEGLCDDEEVSEGITSIISLVDSRG
jgi:hypothetical protein